MTRFPLAWPAGWKRTRPDQRKSAKFSKKTYQAYSSGQGGYYRSGELSIAEGTKRVLTQLRGFGVHESGLIISTNLKLRLDGLPMSNQSEPGDPGVAVYWTKGNYEAPRVIAIDLYNRVADNLAAIAATLEAMRSIERHGGAVILERAFLGFAALPAPNTWRSIFGYDEKEHPDLVSVKDRYRSLSKTHHPDMGGAEAKMQELNWAMTEAEKELA